MRVGEMQHLGEYYFVRQFEAESAHLSHCTSCTEYSHDQARCQGCRLTARKRNKCPLGARMVQESPAIQGLGSLKYHRRMVYQIYCQI